MSDLKPCPVCGDENPAPSPEEESAIDCTAPDCFFFCSIAHWNLLPRTRWVSVDERLPPPDDDSYHQVIRSGRITGGWFAKTKGQGTREFGFGTTHWLGGIPELPPTTDSEARS